MIYVYIMGGLGNQLFQYATALVLQQMQPDKITIDLADFSRTDISLRNFALIRDNPPIINSKECSVLPIATFVRRCIVKLIYISRQLFGWRASCEFTAIFGGIWNMMGFYFCPMKYRRLVKSWNKNQIVTGYFQSHLYFDHIRETILDKFQIITPPTPSNCELMKTMDVQNAVCVHIRRGDYVGKDSMFLVCNEKYYIDGMRIISEKVQKPVFYIFSDDIEWCKTNIAFEYEVIFVEGNNPDYEELRLMSACKHFVISNSTFSWWAQYLAQAPDKVVVAPSRWFNSDIKMDIWMPNWEIVEVK